VLLGLAGVIVLVSGGVGAIVGENAAESAETVRLFGRLALPASGLAVGLFGAALAVVVLAALFALVELASRLEGDDGGAAGPK
jgi:hypothetical protein